MNMKKFALAVIGSFAFVVAFDMFWHAYLMKGMYDATISVWRPESEYNMAVMFVSQFLFAVAFVFAFSKLNQHLPCKKGIMFGLIFGLVLAMPDLGAYCYLPIPLKISLLWMLASILKCVGSGVVIAFICREKVV